MSFRSHCNCHIDPMLEPLLHTSEKIRVLNESADPTVVVRQLFVGLLQTAIQLDDVGVLYMHVP